MSHYKPYPAYRDSEVEWIGEVPEHWSLLRLANVGSLMKANGGNKQDDADIGIPCIRYGDLYTAYDLIIRHIGKFILPAAEADYTPIQYGDILFAASGETFEEIGKSAVNLTDTYACCGGDVIVLRPQRKIDPVYLTYAAGSSSAQAQKSLMGKGFTVIHVYGDQLRNLIIAAPSEQEQKLIGAKIESETARIDALIAKKTRFIELLKEKRQALITHVVTKGLDPNVKMKDSGVEWIGEVPEHWGVKSIGYILDAVGDVDHFMPASVEKGVPYLMTGDLKELVSRVKMEDCKQISHNDYAKLSKRIKSTKGDIIVARYATIGTSMYVDIDTDFLVSYSCVTIKTTPSKVSGLYLFQYLKSDAFYQGINNQINTSTQGNVGINDLKKVKMALPSLSEQSKIVEHLNIKLKNIDSLTEKTQHSIDLLKERRSAFITAAVTGKIDLRESI